MESTSSSSDLSLWRKTAASEISDRFWYKKKSLDITPEDISLIEETLRWKILKEMPRPFFNQDMPDDYEQITRVIQEALTQLNCAFQQARDLEEIQKTRQIQRTKLQLCDEPPPEIEKASLTRQEGRDLTQVF